MGVWERVGLSSFDVNKFSVLYIEKVRNCVDQTTQICLVVVAH